MPLPKNSRYVQEGEVDPGVRELASLFGSQFDAPRLNYHTELFCWFTASCGVGLFTYPKEALRRGLKLLDPADTTTYASGEYSSTNKTTEYPQYFFYAGNLAYPEGGGPATDDAPFFNKTAVKTLEYADGVYRSLFKGHPRADMIVEALMFFDPSGKFGDVLLSDRKVAEEVGVATAEAVASGVPILGKKWIIADLVSYGVDVKKAVATAEDVYFKSGNYLAFKSYNDRFYAVQSILQKVDPFVSDAQVKDVVNSPLSLAAIETVAKDLVPGGSREGGGGGTGAGDRSAGSSSSSGGVSGTTVAVAAGAGALAAFAFGGPIGLAVGAGVLILGSLGGD